MNKPENLGDKYEIVREIKQGGFGIVYCGYDRHLEKPIAVKEISPSLVKDPKYIDMFQAEARNIAKLSHHNIVHVYDLKRAEDGRFYIIMEYIDGLDLEKILKYCRRHGISIPHRLGAYLVAELCLALDYAHTRRDAATNEPLHLVHQDVSPSNIMISKTGEVKLIDFGIASVRRHQRDDQSETTRPGKMPYMSPEMFDQDAQIDHRSDIFSLGLVLYEVLTGQRLLQEQKDLEDLAAGTWRFKGRYLRGHSVPAALERVLDKALETDPARRYQSANQMYIDLLQFLITSTETGGLSEELGNFVRRLMKETEANQEPPPPPAPVEPEPSAEAETLTPTPEPAPPPAPQELAASPATKFEYKEPEAAVDLEDEERFPFEEDLLSMSEEAPQRLSPFPFDRDQHETVDEVVEEGEDDIKTVIDIVRLSARGHKKQIMLGSSFLVLLALLFTVADTAFRWTSLGTGIYDWLFPPAIRVVSIPPQARVFLDDVLLTGTTPLDIDDISPGVHKIRLEVAGYQPVQRSIQVARKGSVTVEGEKLGKFNTYVFRFKTQLLIDSWPQGAEIRLNRVPLNVRTPSRISWEVGVPVSVEMYRAGFEPLTGLTLNTLEGQSQIDDVHNWTVTRSDTGNAFAITGIFQKRIRVTSLPAGAAIYVDGSGQSLGVTGPSSEILLPAGKHTLLLKKAGFIPTELQLDVHETSASQVMGVLQRRVRIYAQDATDPLNRDLGAELVRLIRDGRSVSRSDVTPFEITLLPYTYEAILKKEGYYQTSVKIPPEAFEVVVEMEPVRIPVEVIVTDALQNTPIAGALLSYRDAQTTAPWVTTFEATDANGRLTWSIVPGDYVFRVERDGYIDQTQRLEARGGGPYRLVFNMRGQRTGQQRRSASRPQER
jgi:serine/threonine protein kinase